MLLEESHFYSRTLATTQALPKMCAFDIVTYFTHVILPCTTDYLSKVYNDVHLIFQHI